MADQTPEEVAKAKHEACHARWEQLSPEKRRGATFHGWEAHLPPPGQPVWESAILHTYCGYIGCLLSEPHTRADHDLPDDIQ